MTKNLAIMLVGFAVTIALVALVSASGLPHALQVVLIVVALVPLVGGMLVSWVRIYRDARQRPAAIRYRRIPLALRVLPPALLGVGLATAKALQSASAPPADVHFAAWTGLGAAVLAAGVLYQRARRL